MNDNYPDPPDLSHLMPWLVDPPATAPDTPEPDVPVRTKVGTWRNRYDGRIRRARRDTPAGRRYDRFDAWEEIDSAG